MLPIQTGLGGAASLQQAASCITSYHAAAHAGVQEGQPAAVRYRGPMDVVAHVRSQKGLAGLYTGKLQACLCLSLGDMPACLLCFISLAGVLV